MSHSFETVDYRTALPPTTPAYPTQYTRQPNKPPFLQQQLHIFGEFFWYQIVPSLHWSINDVQLRLQAEPVMAGACHGWSLSWLERTQWYTIYNICMAFVTICTYFLPRHQTKRIPFNEEMPVVFLGTVWFLLYSVQYVCWNYAYPEYQKSRTRIKLKRSDSVTEKNSMHC